MRSEIFGRSRKGLWRRQEGKKVKNGKAIPVTGRGDS
jgi:hypothetical protein